MRDEAVAEPSVSGRHSRDSRAIGRATLTGSAQFSWYLLIAGVVMLFLSRAAVAFAAVPTAVNFVHFPLVFGAFVLSRSDQRTRTQRTGERVLGVSLVIALAAMIGSSATPVLQTALVWAVLVEPFLVIMTVWNLTIRGLDPRAPRNLAVVIVLVQLPVALIQWAQFGSGDDVQGLLVNQGAGHHLLGTLGLVVAVVALDRLFERGTARAPALVMLAGGLALTVMADMRQGIVAFIAAVALVFGPSVVRSGAGPERARGVAAVGLLVISLAAAGLAAGRAFSLAAQEPWRGSAIVDSKVAAVSVVTTAMSDRPLSYLVGLGGGATVTRVAWLATPLGANSFLAGLDLPVSPVASHLAELWLSDPQWSRSSASSPFSTWGGVFGDLGLLGLLAYGAMWWLPWRASADRDHRLETRAVIVFLAILGFIGNWMEEPQLMVVAALVVGAGTAPTVVPPRPTGAPRPSRTTMDVGSDP